MYQVPSSLLLLSSAVDIFLWILVVTIGMTNLPLESTCACIYLQLCFVALLYGFQICNTLLWKPDLCIYLVPELFKSFFLWTCFQPNFDNHIEPLLFTISWFFILQAVDSSSVGSIAICFRTISLTLSGWKTEYNVVRLCNEPNIRVTSQTTSHT